MTLSFRGHIAAICGLALFQGACAPDSAAGRPRGFDEMVFGRGEAEDPARQAAIDAVFCWVTTWFAGDELIAGAGHGASAGTAGGTRGPLRQGRGQKTPFDKSNSRIT